MYNIDWNNFTPQEFFDYIKWKFEQDILPKFRSFGDGLYNISTWLEESISGKKQ